MYARVMLGRGARICVTWAGCVAVSACSLLVGTDDLDRPIAADAGGASSVADGAIADGGAADATPDATPDAAGGATPVLFVGSRLSTSVDSAVEARLPAGVLAGDLLLAVRRDNTTCVSTPPAGWETIGAGAIGDVNGTNRAWIGVHVMTDAETELTTWSFSSCAAATGGTVAVGAFRGARANQPVAPALVESKNAACDGVLLVVEGSPITATVGSLPVVAAVVMHGQTLPELPGFVRDEVSGGVALYHASSPLAAAATLPAPRWEVSDNGCSQRYVTGSLAVRASPP